MKIAGSKVSTAIGFFKKELAGIYPEKEIHSIIQLVFEHYCGFSKTDLVLKASDDFPEFQNEKLLGVLEELKLHKPVQYIVGETEFYGIKLKVNEHVLIPRPETEELVDLIIKENSEFRIQTSELRILDIGTGSGCIAIALKRHLPNAEVTAIDISEIALETAKENAILNQVEINFVQTDILHQPFNHLTVPAFNLIVSNPPYVRFSEKQQMEKNVLDYEPHEALFVDDDDPLLFYRHIITFAKQHLKKEGRVYLEINEIMEKNILELFDNKYFMDIQSKKDLNGKNRIITAELK
ncbi:MAG: protein-(glutamine-N5) methyltransferase, release factor-specific [Flavobacteriales bacterium]|nr:MAG: protein-(glutamine-N5) methyltransferase, release factor-specific [Flavobacteriales bacterium]